MIFLMYCVSMLLIPSQLCIASANEAKSQKGTYYRGENKSGMAQLCFHCFDWISRVRYTRPRLINLVRFYSILSLLVLLFFCFLSSFVTSFW